MKHLLPHGARAWMAYPYSEVYDPEHITLCPELALQVRPGDRVDSGNYRIPVRVARRSFVLDGGEEFFALELEPELARDRIAMRARFALKMFMWNLHCYTGRVIPWPHKQPLEQKQTRVVY